LLSVSTHYSASVARPNGKAGRMSLTASFCNSIVLTHPSIPSQEGRPNNIYRINFSNYSFQLSYNSNV